MGESPTLVSSWTRARHRLEAAGVASPVLDARMLLEAAAGVARIDIVTDPHRPVAPEAEARLEALVARRAAREPIAYILGRRAFWTLDLAVSPAVLSPRPETETLVQSALAALPEGRAFRFLDLGVGSGAISLALLTERPLARAVAVDASADALEVARRNATELGLADRIELRCGDWAVGLEGERFDLVVSNPPYIPAGEIDGLEPEVAQFEPRIALDGGADGLDAYRRIAAALPGLLTPGGRFALEIGRGQDAAVIALLRAAGLRTDAVAPDLNGIGRVVLGGEGA